MTKLDVQDVELFAGRALCTHRSAQAGRVFYASASSAIEYDGGRSRYAHRVIMQAPAAFEVDHINGDTLDNRRSNLRLCTRADNAANRRRLVHPHGFRGILNLRGKWVARLKVDQRVHTVGAYDSPIIAARVYDAAARFAFGDFAVTNFPDEIIPDEAQWPLEIFRGDLAQRLLAKGVSVADIAGRANVTPDLVARWLDQRATGHRPHGAEKPKIQEGIARLYRDGLSYGAIGRALGMDQSAVRGMAKRMVLGGKLEPRPYGQKFRSA
jgi:hypothetical protein